MKGRLKNKMNYYWYLVKTFMEQRGTDRVLGMYRIGIKVEGCRYPLSFPIPFPGFLGQIWMNKYNKFPETSDEGYEFLKTKGMETETRNCKVHSGLIR